MQKRTKMDQSLTATTRATAFARVALDHLLKSDYTALGVDQADECFRKLMNAHRMLSEAAAILRAAGAQA